MVKLKVFHQFLDNIVVSIPAYTREAGVRFPVGEEILKKVKSFAVSTYLGITQSLFDRQKVCEKLGNI